MEDKADERLPVDPDVPADARVGAGRAAPGGRGAPPWDVVAVIAAGGAVGGAARWTVNHLVPTPTDGFPWATFTENVTGSLLLGALMVFLLDVWRPRRYTRPFWGVGVLGGYTTFSTYTADTVALVRDGLGPIALAYAFGSLAAGLAAAWLGMAVVRATVVRPREGRRGPAHRRSP